MVFQSALPLPLTFARVSSLAEKVQELSSLVLASVVSYKATITFCAIIFLVQLSFWTGQCSTSTSLCIACVFTNSRLQVWYSVIKTLRFRYNSHFRSQSCQMHAYFIYLRKVGSSQTPSFLSSVLQALLEHIRRGAFWEQRASPLLSSALWGSFDFLRV